MSEDARVVLVYPKAQEDIAESADFIARDSLDAALRFFDSVEATFQFLASHPETGSAREYSATALKGTRVWPVKDFENWLIFYQVAGLKILVIRVLHGARDIDHLP